MDDLASNDPIAAWTLLDDILSVTAAKQDDEHFMWSPMVKNIVNAARPAWLSKTYDVAAARDEPGLWELWARLACRRIVDLLPHNPAEARALLDNIRSVA